MRTTNWYDNPLYYDIIFDQDTGVEADFLETVARRHGRRRGAWRILEPACGSGRLLREFSRRGHTVHGFDANPSMLAYAAGRQDPGKPRARLWRDRMEAFTVPRGRGYDLAHCLVSTFKYLLTEEQAAAHLQQVASVLVPGGLYVIGLHLTDYTCPAIQHERWVGRRGRTGGLQHPHLACPSAAPAGGLTHSPAHHTPRNGTHRGNTLALPHL